MKLPKYILALNPEQDPEQEIILCTEKPYYAACVMKFKQDWKAAKFEATSDHLITVRVPGYDIILYFSGSIEGTRVTVTPDYEARVSKILKEMANYYLRVRIAKNKYQFNKYLTDKQCPK
jgi:hypothetical protein